MSKNANISLVFVSKMPEFLGNHPILFVFLTRWCERSHPVVTIYEKKNRACGGPIHENKIRACAGPIYEKQIAMKVTRVEDWGTAVFSGPPVLHLIPIHVRIIVMGKRRYDVAIPARTCHAKVWIELRCHRRLRQ